MSTIASHSGRMPLHPVRHLNEESLVAQAKLGSEQAFTELWSRHGKRARTVVLQIMRNREDAEDALQETYLKSFLHLVKFNGESQFSTWLYRIATNEALMSLRKRRRRLEGATDTSVGDSTAPASDIPDRRENIEMHCIHSDLIRQLRCAIRQLPDSLREVVELQNRDDLTLLEIAARTGLSVPAIKARLVRARAALRQITAQGQMQKRSQTRRRSSRRYKSITPSDRLGGDTTSEIQVLPDSAMLADLYLADRMPPGVQQSGL